MLEDLLSKYAIEEKVEEFALFEIKVPEQVQHFKYQPKLRHLYPGIDKPLHTLDNTLFSRIPYKGIS